MNEDLFRVGNDVRGSQNVTIGVYNKSGTCASRVYGNFA
jgi:hypothetical protein